MPGGRFSHIWPPLPAERGGELRAGHLLPVFLCETLMRSSTALIWLQSDWNVADLRASQSCEGMMVISLGACRHWFTSKAHCTFYHCVRYNLFWLSWGQKCQIKAHLNQSLFLKILPRFLRHLSQAWWGSLIFLCLESGKLLKENPKWKKITWFIFLFSPNS